MAKAELIHFSQGVDSSIIGTDCDGIGCHHLRQDRSLNVLSSSKRTYRISSGEDARQTILVINHEN
jgi:hypothetical protein